MSSTPTRKFHIIQPVVVNQNARSSACMSRCRFRCLSCSSRIPPWPWTIAFGRPVVPLEYRTHSGWSKATGSSTSGASAALPRKPVLPAAAVEVAQPHERPADARVDLVDDLRAIEVAPAVAIAVDGEQHRRLDLREAVDHRARAEVRRAARPDRAEPGRGQERRDGLGDVRHVGRDAVAATDAERAQARLDARGDRAQLRPRHLLQRAQLGGVADRHRVVVAAAEDVLGIGERRAGKPPRAGHLATREHLARRGVEAHVEVLGDRRPEALEVADRPAPQLVVPATSTPW